MPRPAASERGSQGTALLDISAPDVDYLAAALRRGVRQTPVRAVRDNAPFGVLCEVRIAVAGLRERRTRVAIVTTAWELRCARARPRLVTAYVES